MVPTIVTISVCARAGAQLHNTKVVHINGLLLGLTARHGLVNEGLPLCLDREGMSARPVCLSNQNKRVYAFILFIWLLLPHMGRCLLMFSIFHFFMFVSVFFKGRCVFHLLLPIFCAPFPQKMYVLPCNTMCAVELVSRG